MDALLVAAALIVLHTVDGFEIVVNSEHIVILRPTSEAAKGKPNQLVTKGVTCVIGLSDGKFVSVVETCEVVREVIEKTRQPR